MRSKSFILAFFALLAIVAAQWDDDPNQPGDPDDGDPDDDDPRQPTPTRRPTPAPTQRPSPSLGFTLSRGPTLTSAANPDDTDVPAPLPSGIDTFANVTLYQPDDSTHYLTSPRSENLPNNTILAVWNDPEQANGTLPVYRSTNDGFSWYSQGTVKSTVSGRALLEPHLLFVEGSWSGETNLTLVVVNAVDAKSTNIELYASWDQGATFDFVHRVAEGGPANVASGGKAVGEPFLLLHDKRLTVFYSDQRDSKHTQKITHQSTADIWGTWGTATDVSTSDVLVDQQGSTSAVKLPNDHYIIVFESAPGGNTTAIKKGPISFKLSATPENVATERSREVITITGAKPKGAPFVTWSSVGGANGTIVLSDSTSNTVFVNQALGEGLWKEIKTMAGRAYAREVRAVPNDMSKLRIIGGSEDISKSSDILVTILDLKKALAAL